jgi:hypothetical protein
VKSRKDENSHERNGLETNDHAIGGIGQRHIRGRDGTDHSLQHADSDFGMRLYEYMDEILVDRLPEGRLHSRNTAIRSWTLN